MNLLCQIILSEPGLLAGITTAIAGIAWTLKKVIDIDNRLGRIEERCHLICKK